MEILRSDSKSIRLSLSRGDLVFVNNILNEVCNGFRVADFIKQIGINQQNAHILLARVHDAGERPSGEGSGKVDSKEFRQNCTALDFTRAELMAIRNALCETLRGLGIEEFDTRVGFRLRKAKLG